MSSGSGEEKQRSIVRDPIFSLASATGTYKRISDGTALAKVRVVGTRWANVTVSWLQRVDGERYKRVETIKACERKVNQISKRLTTRIAC